MDEMGLREIAIDDVYAGETYTFVLKNGFARGVFSGWIYRGRGQSLVVLLARQREVLSFALSEVVRVLVRDSRASGWQADRGGIHEVP